MAKISVIGTEIPANQTTSGEVDLGHHNLVAIEFPSTYNGSSTVTFQAKVNRKEDLNPNGDESVEQWRNVYDSAGNELAIVVGSNRVVTDIPELAPLRYVRVRSGTSAAPVAMNPGVLIRFIVKE